MTIDDIRGIVSEILRSRGSFHTSQVAEKAGLSRQMAHKYLSRLVAEGTLVREGRGRGARYRSSDTRIRVFRMPVQGATEDEIWRSVETETRTMLSLSENDQRLLYYAATELINNVIDHSGATEVQVTVAREPERVILEVLDEGVGAFEHVRRRLGLPDALSAIEELSKGRVTTDPARHTGEGLFFVSKLPACFEMQSGALSWKMDNARGDFAIGTAPPRSGTRVRIELIPGGSRSLADLFGEYAIDFEFSKTRTYVKLFERGGQFISRPEAKRLLHGLEKFREIVLDFSGVDAIGQGFADEVFRVWARAHPDSRLLPVNMNAPVRFMVARAGHR
jgi:anti-sigma regulatory factor (Ser/Thr protein kinase)